MGVLHLFMDAPEHSEEPRNACQYFLSVGTGQPFGTSRLPEADYFLQSVVVELFRRFDLHFWVRV